MVLIVVSGIYLWKYDEMDLWLKLMLPCVVIGNFIVAYYQYSKQQSIGVIYERFARENGMTYRYENEQLPGGILFRRRNEGTCILRHTVRDNELEFGNYEYEIGTGKYRRTVTAGYFAVTLEKSMPHILLDSRKNNFRLFGEGASNLGTTPDREQRLVLEGDFGEHFDVYTPAGSERDALSILTPDVMALLIDHGGDCDIEIIGNRLYVYLPRPFDKTKSGVVYVQRVLDVLVDKLSQRTPQFLQHDTDGVPLAASQLQISDPISNVRVIVGVLVGLLVVLGVVVVVGIITTIAE